VAIIVEGARRRGFKIMKMANVEEDVQNKKFVQELVDRQRKLKESHQLNYAA
jgi:acetolactate synthase regulatory subunit